MKKIFSFMLVLFSVLCLIACKPSPSVDGFVPVEKDKIKVGLICLHNEQSTYDANFINSMRNAVANLGLKSEQLEIVTGIGEDASCYTKAVELANTCNVVFADSFGHEDFIIQAAEEIPNVRFCHATGEKAHLVKLDNFSNAFASIYEGRYLAGIAAGMKLNEMNADKEEKNFKMGYVGAFPYAEVISGYSSFYLGAKSVCPEVTMDVVFTSTWYDFNLEYAAAKSLIEVNGCALISQHADSYGAPQACEEAGVPNVTYNGTTVKECPNTYVISSKIDWTPYFEYMINCVINGEKIDTDWTGTIASGSVKLEDVGSCAAEGTAEAIEAAKAKLLDGTLHVFDLSTFTVGGETLTSVMANVDFDEKYAPDTEAVIDGYFAESKFRSAPYFELAIDGINKAQ